MAGNNAPSAKELHLIMDATGATLIRSLSESQVSDPSKTIVITSDPSTDAQCSENGVERVTRLGAKLLSTTWLFHTIITQKISNMDAGGEGGTATSARQHPEKQRSKRKAAVKTPPGHGNRRKSSRKR